MLCKNCLSSDLIIMNNTSEYSLIKCNSCTFLFKDISEINYELLTEKDYACYNFERENEITEIDNIIKKYYKKDKIRVLEIGSGTSSLLKSLSESGYDCIGVEPSKVAVQLSEKVYPDIEVVNEYFTSDLIKKEIDVILLYDVVEHLEPNNKLYKEINSFMTSETLLLIKSGNPSSFNAKLLISRWVYLLIDQHISFYSPKALKIFCENLDLNIVKYYKFKHAYGGLHLFRILKNIFKILLNKFYLDSSLKRNISIGLANDHFIAVIKKNIL